MSGTLAGGRQCVKLGALHACPRPRPSGRPASRVAVHGFKDELLDFVLAGPKMRRWYGEGELLPQDGDLDLPPMEPPPAPQDQQVLPPEKRTHILVTDADSPLGEQVLVQLILARAKIKALTRSKQRLQVAFGDYIDSYEATVDNTEVVQRCLADVKTVICTGAVGSLPAAAASLKLPHLVLLASAGQQGGFVGRLFESLDSRVLKDESRQARARQAGVPCTTVLSGAILQRQGGRSNLAFEQDPSEVPGTIAQEDLACVLAQAALQPPPAASYTVSVGSQGAGELPQDWQHVFDGLHKKLPVS